jgi:pimeloyl-ACP methyl ester carboxylesterase
MPGVTHDGVTIGYEVAGEGHSIILLHGWLTDRSWWTEFGFVDALMSDHQVVTVDLRGHGRSSAPHGREAYRGEEQVGDLLAVADAVGIDRFAVWGLSLGGWVAWFAALTAPERVQALVTTGCWDPLQSERTGWSEEDEPLLTLLRSGDMAAAVATFENGEGSGARVDDFEFPPEILSVMRLSDPIAAADCFEESNSSGIADVAAIATPTLLISGELEDPEDDAAAMAARLQRGERLRLANLDHAGAGAASELTIPTVRAFLNQWMAPTITG